MHRPLPVDEASSSDFAVEEVRYFKLGDAKYMALPLSEFRNLNAKTGDC